MTAGSRNKRLALLVSEYGYFLSHRLSLARAAVEQGYVVYVFTKVPTSTQIINEPHINIIHIDIQRSIRNPAREIQILYFLRGKLKKLDPHILHNFSVKLALIGSLAGVSAGVSVIVNTYTGLGYVFQSANAKSKIVRSLLRPIFRWISSNSRCWSVFQNEEDAGAFSVFSNVPQDRCNLIRGSGVDMSVYQPVCEPEGDTVVLFAGRLLWDKGIGEFISAVKMLNNRGVKCQFYIAGEIDPENPQSINRTTLNEWQTVENVKWLGQKNDMQEVYRQSHIVCLPSYHEGLPKVLLEAAASGKPIVTSAIPGCSDIVNNNVNGFLVPKGDAEQLAEKLEILILNKELRIKMGGQGRQRVEEEFSASIINKQVLGLYAQALS